MSELRQQLRANARVQAFQELTERYSLEPRRVRRSIARTLVHKWWQRGAKAGEKFLAPVGRGISIAAIVTTLFCAAGPWAANTRAQGSRKDDVVFNARGQPLAGATIRVCGSAATTTSPCTPLA